MVCLVGGDAENLAAARPALETFAPQIVHVGSVGHGQLAKALNNALYNVSIAAMAEVLPLAQRAGLDVDALVKAVEVGSGRSFGFQRWARPVLERRFAAKDEGGYPMREAHKDLESVRCAAAGCGVEVPRVLAAAFETFEEAIALGAGEDHKGAMVKVWEQRLGVECRTAIRSPDS